MYQINIKIILTFCLNRRSFSFINSSKLSLSSLVCLARKSSSDTFPLPPSLLPPSSPLPPTLESSESWERWEAGVDEPLTSAGVSKVAGLFSMLRKVDVFPSLAYFLNNALSFPTLLLSLASIYSILSFKFSRSGKKSRSIIFSISCKMDDCQCISKVVFIMPHNSD